MSMQIEAETELVTFILAKLKPDKIKLTWL